MKRLYNKVWDDPHYEGLMANQGWLASVIEDHDHELAARLRSLLRQDPRILPSDKNTLKIDVAQGIVYLYGCVQSPLSLDYANLDAMSLSDDIEIVNHIQLKQDQAVAK